MIKFSVFMRGVNVNGVKIKMDELRRLLKESGYKDAKTIQASGNIVVSYDAIPLTLDKHKDKLQKTLGDYYNYEAYVFIKNKNQIGNIIAEAEKNNVSNEFNHYVLINNDQTLAKRLLELFNQCEKDDGEQIILGEYGIYWIVKKGMTLKTKFGKKVLGMQEFKDRLTSRTLNTIKKVNKLMEEQ